MHFPVSGVECSPFLPPLVAFAISGLTASAGVSGAFLLLPFQMSVLGFVSPAVSPTNLVYNIVAIPGGAYRYIREGRMVWPLAWMIIGGTLPGLLLGCVIRVRFLPDPRTFKLFAGTVLVYLAIRLLGGNGNRETKPLPSGAEVKTRSTSLRRVVYEFRGETFSFRPVIMLAMTAGVGLVGGVYGIGGGALVAPLLVAVAGLPVHTIAGAAMFGAFVSSFAGAGIYQALAVSPDWELGVLFGAGGLAGTYVGARLQKRLPERWIRLFLAVIVAALACGYIARFFF